MYSTVTDSLSEPPKADFQYLETLWFQISGTLCNLRCKHCFISCSPENHTLEMMQENEIFEYLDQAKSLGVKEIYYTGGEPFIHQGIMRILERTLVDFPASVLTNGLPINAQRVDQLRRIVDKSKYTLEIRISLDDYDPERNDAVRGKGTFRQAMDTYKRLYENGFLPILTVSEIGDYLYPHDRGQSVYQNFTDLLQSIGIDKPRIKILPVFEMGMLPSRSQHRLTHKLLENFDHSLLQCSSSRMIAHDGIYACPILVGQEKAKMGKHFLGKTLHSCSLYHTSCHTCFVTGMTCKNF